MLHTPPHLTIGIINHELARYRQSGASVTLPIEGAPSLEVISFDPLAYREYNRTNRAPQLAGKFAVNRVFSENASGGSRVYLGLQAPESNGGYGVEIDTADPGQVDILNRLLKTIGLGVMRFPLSNSK